MKETEIIELLDEVIKYIEMSETTIDGEWGSCRNIEQLKKDGEVTPLLEKVEKYKKEIK